MDYVQNNNLVVMLHSEQIMRKPCKDIVIIKTNYPYVDIEFSDGRIATIDMTVKDIIVYCDNMVKISRGCFIKDSFIKSIEILSRKKSQKSIPRKFTIVTTIKGTTYRSSSTAFYNEIFRFLFKKGLCTSKKSLRVGSIVSLDIGN